MKRICLITLIISILGSCSEKKKRYNDAIYYYEFYSALNSIIKTRLTDVSVIELETLPVYRTKWGNIPTPKDQNTMPPGDILTIAYVSSDFLNTQIEKKNLDSVDAKFMNYSIDSTKIFNIDSTKVIIPVISKSRIKGIFENNDIDTAYEILGCFISVSTPIFNATYTKLILCFNYQCGPRAGQGYVFILEKRNGKWNIIDKGRRWVS